MTRTLKTLPSGSIDAEAGGLAPDDAVVELDCANPLHRRARASADAHRMLPSSPEIELALSELYARKQQRDEALARLVATWGHCEETEAPLHELFGSVAAPESP